MPLVMAMVAGAPRPDETKKYLDWLLTDEAQRLMAQSFFRPVMKVDLGPELQQQFPPTRHTRRRSRSRSRKWRRRPTR
jgi:putative spermidine/putrescine transport system substrate-binding protein